MMTEQFKEELRDVDGTKVRVTTYKIGNDYYCHVSNYDPDATIARSSAVTIDDAVSDAMKKATQRILQFRR